ncbi:tRNA (N6-isopentenyl adenosine(37)-C2)-methylthiotransferase MiaB [Dehalococcoides mccartyi]|uniref:tRNA (N6-isopentenyl adenosine(37)-C2)-methylthiotransferase MiaB n=1 Tax=Dehalococcoides mccartyi TaxID=61435 RepID=UPI00098ED2FA|nr:tRNA (N6-isopentenyl adenosine(37)-C2)-methylthiotransferase MiaB [Dehalococcoides mccartyi]AQU03836.1 tRNA (N6-isopentenyl adenosine(37)-C2)-methylthiotransferase MiaB [Dehalococcoides mccartyi]AQU05132.1 tRNA (N6-isopentenyl adenosine(37)-C2)-methylthiotransferase MiaB [Dehalococcoides mccartyi]
MPGYYLWTIGCQMNQAESERLGRLFELWGYSLADKAEDAELVLVNSCVVREHAENKVINRLHILRKLKDKNPRLKIALTGCLVGQDIAFVRKKFPFVDYIFQPGALPDWGEIPEGFILPLKPPVSASITIMQGCDNFCTYCIVPYRRGREKSRSISEICCEAAELVRRGSREVVLLGQNVDSYGHDLPEKPCLADLLYALSDIPGLFRIRFLTSHPKDISQKLIDAMASLPKVCHSLSLPVQAGADTILAAMRRGYTSEQYRELVGRLKTAMPDISLQTDLIVGFPSETAEQFDQSYKLMSDIGYDAIHVAAYSPRPQTAAARDMADDVPLAEKKRRLKLIEDLQKETVSKANSALVDTFAEVLVEGRQKNKWQGRTLGGKLVFLESDLPLEGCLVEVKIFKASPWSLQAKLVKILES